MRPVAVAVCCPQAIGVVAPAAAAYDALVRGAGKRARRPLPDIAGHIVEAKGERPSANDPTGAVRENPSAAEAAQQSNLPALV